MLSLKNQSILIKTDIILISTKNATRCNSRNDLLHLQFENFNISGGLYITQLNIYDEAFITKAVKYIHEKAPSQIFTWVLNAPLLFEHFSNSLLL